jgi:hypothetical protein
LNRATRDTNIDVLAPGSGRVVSYRGLHLAPHLDPEGVDVDPLATQHHLLTGCQVGVDTDQEPR